MTTETRRPGSWFHQSAGAVVLSDGLFLVLRRQREWVLPKGHLEEGESHEQAARREVGEETGLTVDIVAELGETSYSYVRRTRPARHHKNVRWFLAAVRSGSLAPGDPFDEARLVGPETAMRLLTHQADRDLVLRAQALSRWRQARVLSVNRMRSSADSRIVP